MCTPQPQAKEAVDFLKKEGLSGTAKKAADSLLATVEQAKAVPNYIGEQANQLLAKVSAAWEKLAQMPAGEMRCAFSYLMLVLPGLHLTKTELPCSSSPAVQKTLDSVSPSVEMAKKQYIAAHDAVVVSLRLPSALSSPCTKLPPACMIASTFRCHPPAVLPDVIVLVILPFPLQTAPAYNKAVVTGQEVFSKVQTTYVYKTAANRLYPVIAPYADPVVVKVAHSPYVNNAIEHLKPQVQLLHSLFHLLRLQSH